MEHELSSVGTEMRCSATGSPLESPTFIRVSWLRRLRDRFYLARRALLERIFDWRHGVFTSGQFLATDFPIGAGRDANAYTATTARQLRHIVATVGIDPSRFTFVDLGAGKGRTLVVALELGFRAVIGIELSPALAVTAERNLATYATRRGNTAPTRIIAADAASFTIPSEATFIYLFNPFGETTIKAVLRNLEHSLGTRSERLLIAYLRPQYDSLFAGAAFLSLIGRAHPRSVGPFSLYEAAAR